MKDRAVADAVDLAKKLQRYTQTWRRHPSLADATEPALLDVARYVEFMPHHRLPPRAALEKWIEARKFALQDCRSAYLSKHPRCWIVDVDLNADGAPDFALFTGRYLNTVLQQQDGSWAVGPNLKADSPPSATLMQDAMKRGDVQSAPHEMRDLIVGGVRFK
jgi:hypothetical protein